MAMDSQAIRQLKIVAETQGIDQAISSAKALGGALEVTAVTTEKATASVEGSAKRLERVYDPAAKAALDFQKTMSDLGRALEANPERFSNLDTMLGNIQQKFGGMADAATLNAAGYSRLAQAVADYNVRLATQAELQSRVAQSQAQAQGASAYQASLNSRLGVVAPGDQAANTAARAADVQAYAKALEAERAALVPTAAAAQQYEAQLARIAAALKSELINEEEAAAATTRAKTAYEGQVAAVNGLASAHGGINSSTQAAMHAVRGFTEQVALGISPLQALTSEASHLSYVMSQPGGLSGAFGGIGSMIVGALSSPLAPLAALAAAVGAGAVAWHSYRSAQDQVALALSTTGRAAGVTKDQIEGIAEGVANSSRTSISEARNVATELAKTGQIGKDALAGIAVQADTFAKAIGSEKISDAAKQLAQDFAEPAKGIDDLAQKLGGIDAKTVAYVKTLDAQGNRQQAQAAMADAMRQALAKTAEELANQPGVWDRATKAASDFWTTMGKGPDGGTIDQQIAQLQKLRDAEAAAGPTQTDMGVISNASLIANYDQQIAKLRELKKAQEDAANADAEMARAAQQSNIADQIIRGIYGEIDAYTKLQAKISELSAAINAPDGLSAAQLANAEKVKAALQAFRDANYGPGGKFGDDPAAAQSFKLGVDYQNQLAAIQATTVEQKAAAAAAAARTAAERDLSTAINAGQIAEQARGAVLAQSQVQMQQALQAKRDELALEQMTTALGNSANSPGGAGELAAMRAENDLRRQGIDLKRKDAQEYVDLSRAIAEESAARAENLRQYQEELSAVQSGTKSYGDVFNDVAHNVANLTQAQLDNVAAADRQAQALARAKQSAEQYAQALNQAVQDMAKMGSEFQPGFLPNSAANLFQKYGTVLDRNAEDGGGYFDASGKPVGSITSPLQDNIFAMSAQLQQLQAMRAAAASASTGSPADQIAQSLNALLANAQSNLQSAQQSGAANDNASDPNGSKTAPKLDAYAERNASIYYGTESGNYYSDAIQKSQSTQEQILSTNQDQLATAQAEFNALQQIATMANQMVAQGAKPDAIAQAVASALQQIGLGASAQSVLQAADQIKQQMRLASLDAQIAMVQSNINAPMAGTNVGGVIGGGGTLGSFSTSSPFGATGAVDSYNGKFAGMFAAGGDIPAGSYGIAGEGGKPEIITGPATVTPLDKLSAGGAKSAQPITIIQHNTITVNTTDGQKVMRGLTSAATQNVATRRVMGGASAA